jgi:hypothetical protein
MRVMHSPADVMKQPPFFAHVVSFKPFSRGAGVYQANPSKTHFPFLLPCHRVIHGTGDAMQFGGEQPIKKNASY